MPLGGNPAATSHGSRSPESDSTRAEVPQSPAHRDACVALRILGPVEAGIGRRQLDIGGPRQMTLFAYLLLHANRAIRAEAVTDALWPGCDIFGEPVLSGHGRRSSSTGRRVTWITCISARAPAILAT